MVPILIRAAVAADIPRMVEMGRRFLSNSPYKKHLADSPETMTGLGERILRNEGGGILVSEQNGKITGMLGFIVYEHFISGEKVGGEVFWWVEPEHRGDGVRLLREAEKCVKSAGAKSMQMIAPDDRVKELYLRSGYEFMESSFVRTF